MTAATMGYHRRGSQSNDAIFSNPRVDVLERFFEGWESFFCGATQSKESLAKETLKEPDVFDYVFESVESFTCREGSSTPRDYPYRYREQERREGNHHKSYTTSSEDELALRRENSLVEQGPNGGPLILHPLSKQQQQQQQSLLLGREGDFLDYCFEHVESYVCSEGGDPHEFGRNQSLASKSSSYYNYSQTSSKGSYPLPTRNTTNQQAVDRERRLEYEPEDQDCDTTESSSYSPGRCHPIPSEISAPRFLRKKKKSRQRRRRRRQNYYPDEEDNVLLYYRPMKQDE